MRTSGINDGRIFPQQSSSKFGDVSQLDLNVPQVSYEEKLPASTIQNQGVSTGLSTSKKIIISVIVVLILLGAAAAGIVLGVMGQKQITPTPDDQNYVTPNPNPQQPITSCDDVPAECAGVPLGVSNYIFTNYTSNDQIRSLLQASRTLAGISATSTAQELVSSYRDILRSAECMAYTLSDSYATAYQDIIALQMTDANAILAYLNMNQAASGEPVRLTPTQELINNCQFNVNNPARRMLDSASNCSGADATSVLVYFDGFGSSPSSTIQNLREIQNILINQTGASFDGGSVALGPLRNPSSSNYFQGLVSDYLDYQRQNGGTDHSLLDLYRSLQLMLDSNVQLQRLPIAYEQYQQFITYFRTTSIQSFLNNQAEYNLNRHRDFIVQQVSQGKKVVLVAYGEATIYANIIYNLLTAEQKSSVSQVFIAPFASSMADNSNAYVSHADDQSLSGVRQESLRTENFAAPLSSNQDARNFSSILDSGDNHGIRGYLQSFRQIIVQLITQARIRVVQPPRTLGSGPITAVLTWDSQRDLDFHIFEPNYHVYYVQKTGNSGELDLDDTNGYGPEHYYTNCNIETGDYTFKVNYYSGSAPSRATVTISAGSEYFTKDLVLETPRGGGGDANPEYSICTVTVSRSPLTNSYVFSITPL